jgi:ABC-type uncharacterized transport system permease subunit
MNELNFIAQQAMYFSIPLLIVALGGMFSERSGVVNIALEGIMVMGAFTGVATLNIIGDKIPGQWPLVIAILVAGATGILFSLLHAFASINMRADQTISGTALNLFAPAFCIFVARMVQGSQNLIFNGTKFYINKVPVLGDIPVIGPMFFQKAYITTYLGFLILILSSIVLYKTRFGLRLRACGEHPQAADSVGINVYKIRYSGVSISGFLAGIGGLVFIVPTSTQYSASVAGYGFLALAVLIFGQWKPKRILVAALFFGIMKTLANSYISLSFLKNLPIPSGVYKMIPYIATLIVLAFTSKNSQAPRAAGVPYDKSTR